MPGTENANYTVDVADTATFGNDDRTAFWAEHVCRNHGALRFRFVDAEGFRGRTVVQRAGGRQLVDFRSDGIRYERTPLDLRRDGDTSMRLLVPVSGAFVTRQGGRTVPVAPGTAALLSQAAPFLLEPPAEARALVLTLPGAAPSATGHRRGPAVGPRAIDLGVGVGAVVGSMLTAIAAQARTVDGAQFRLVVDTVGALLADGVVAGEEDDPRGLAAIDVAVREHVRRNAADPTLTAAGVARDLGWSLRQVQLAVARTGTTPSRLLRDARLDRARELLATPGRPSVADVAFASGFRSLSVFTARFKERFGRSPGAWRDASARRPDGPDDA